MEEDWSELDYDVLSEIAFRMDAIEDFVYFSVVCRSWNRASSLVKCKWKPSMPYLLLAENNCNENPGFLRKVCSLNNDRCYQLSLPHTYGARCWGSNCGWIVTINLRLEISLHNPFTKARLRLPPQPTFPNQEPTLYSVEKDAIYKRQGFIRKARVVKDVGRENNGNDLIVLATHIHSNRNRLSLSFARPGDLTWTSIVPPWPLDDSPDSKRSHSVLDVMCKERSILILYGDISVGYLDLADLTKSTNLEQPIKAKEFLPSSEYFKALPSTWSRKSYLIESFGSLLIVLRHKNQFWDPYFLVREDEIYKTVGFDVFRIDFKTKKWDPVNDLGDVALFVGDNQSISVRASDCRNCKSNCIYFTDDCDEFLDWTSHAGRDMGLYKLDDGKFYQFYKGDNVHSDFCTPFWFMPRF